MSTKTTIKRIALVAISALGLGFLSVVPASATNRTVAVQAVIANQNGVVGQTTSVQIISGNLSGNIDAACQITFTPTSSGAGAGIDTAASTGTELDTGANGWAIAASGIGALTMTASGTYADATTTKTNGKIVGILNFTPTSAGTYTITVTKTSAGAGCTNVPANNTFTFSVIGEATPSTIVVGKTTESPTGTALAAGYYTPWTVLNSNGISAFTVDAGSTVKLAIIPVGGASAAGAKVRLSYPGTGIFFTSAAMAGSAAGTAELLDAFTAPTTAGTYVINGIYDEGAVWTTTDDQRTFSVTMTVSALSPLSAAKSTHYHSAEGSLAATSTTDLYPSYVSKAAGTQAGNILVTLNRADGTAYGDTTATVYAYVSGSGLIDITADQTDLNGDSVTDVRSDSLAVPSDGIFNINVTADGTPGTGTVTFYVIDAAGVKTDLGTETFNFFGNTTKLVATQGIKTIRTATSSGNLSGYTGTTPGAYDIAAIAVKATDSLGTPVVGLGGLSCKIADLTIINSCTITEDAGTSLYTLGRGTYIVQLTTADSAKSGDSTSVYVRMIDPNGDGTTYLTTATLTFKVASKTVASTTLTLDKTSYAPGEKATLTVTSKDSSGNTVADTWSTGSTRACVGSDVIANKSVTGSLPVAADGCYMANGVETYKFYVPSVGGEFTLNTTSPADGVTPIVITASVDDPAGSSAAIDAANEATDAANAATDAANAAAEAADAATAAAQDAQAAVAALATQVSSLIAGIKKQLTSLSNLIIKIQKKVKA